MRYGVLGTGMVGQAIAGRLVEVGHDVVMGSRSAGNERAAAWAAAAGDRAATGTFADAAAFGEIVVNATAGDASMEVLRAAGQEHLDGKVVVDVANPLDHATWPPTLTVVNTDSLGEQIQRAFPAARVVKTLNTMNAAVMVRPDRVPGTHAVFVCGDDPAAKDEVRGLLSAFGWTADQILDLGDITAARGTEMYLALWLRLLGPVGDAPFNIAVHHP